MGRPPSLLGFSHLSVTDLLSKSTILGSPGWLGGPTTLRSDCGQELDVWGGDFYTDQFYAALEQLGPQLAKLNLVHVEELDFRAVKILSLTCTNINTLGLYNCGFREPTPADDEVGYLPFF